MRLNNHPEGHLRILIDDYDHIADMATAYSKAKSNHYRSKIEIYRHLSNAKGEQVNSVLGSIIVGTIKFLFNTIVNCVKYLALSIKALIFDSQIIPSILGGIASILESNTIVSIKILDKRELEPMMKNFEKMVKRRTERITRKKGKVLTTGDEMIDFFDRSLDTEILSERERYVELYRGVDKRDKDIKSLNRRLASEYRSWNRRYDSKRLHVNHDVTVNTIKERTLQITNLKDLLKYYFDSICVPYGNYMELVVDDYEACSKMLKKIIETDASTLSEDDSQIVHAYSEVISTFITHYTIDLKNMNETVAFFKREIVSSLLSLTDYLETK